MTYEEAITLAISVLHDAPDVAQYQEAADVLDRCYCAGDFTDGTAYCQECGRRA